MADKKATVKATPAKKAKKVAFSDLTAMKREDLVSKISELREEITTLRRGMHNGEVQNVRAAGVKKRELARVLTALSANSGEEKK
jgi:ribosomal protein L29